MLIDFVGPSDVRTPRAEGNFPTSSAKCEFKSSLASPSTHGQIMCCPSSHPIRRAELAKRYSFTIVSPKPHVFLNSQYGNAADK
ncbi:MAG: hypothetical protein JO309_10095 [Pseudonocardiales bacterium]|nr:hypothetical protein [Pseudonocardiales bacterium]MBV9729731.1 hypothetical protein [Pseudonocardiales bacterium]